MAGIQPGNQTTLFQVTGVLEIFFNALLNVNHFFFLVIITGEGESCIFFAVNILTAKQIIIC